MFISEPAPEAGIAAMRALIRRNGEHVGVVDFEEHILLPGIRSTMRLWRSHGRLAGFAYVDDFDNLWFELDRDCDSLPSLETEIVAWGLRCLRERAAQKGSDITLDASCAADDAFRIRLFERNGFTRGRIRTLRYARSLDLPIEECPLPTGFFIRSVRGSEEVPRLVALHRAAFGTDKMTVEQRLAMMSTPQYKPELDLVVVAPDDELAAFCVCGWEVEESGIAFTDPIGTHPLYRGRGLTAAAVTAGLLALREAGAHKAVFGTSSENIAMQALATKLGFTCVSERLWFSKTAA